MMQRIYAWPLNSAILIVMITLAGWSYFNLKVRPCVKATANNCLLCAAAFGIFYATILTRSPGGDYALILTPFASFTAAKEQPEFYREMLMNVFLFFPFGLALSNALPGKWYCWVRILLTTLIGCILSVCIEYAQFRYALGTAEVDDVICNTLGALLGSTSLLIAHAIRKIEERFDS